MEPFAKKNRASTHQSSISFEIMYEIITFRIFGKWCITFDPWRRIEAPLTLAISARGDLPGRAEEGEAAH